MALSAPRNVRIKINFTGFQHVTKLNHDPVINVEVRRGKKAVSAEVRCEKVKYDSDGKATERDYLFDKEKTEAEEKRSIEDSREPVENVRLTNEKEAKRVAELEARRAAEEEATRAAEEEAMRATEEEATRAAEEEAMRATEEEAMRAAEEEATRAAEEEAMRAAEEEAMRAAEELEKRIADEERKRATEAARREKEMELRAILIEVMNTQNREAILEAIKEARGAYMTELYDDIADAENVLDMLEAGERLKDAMARRHLGDVEAAVNNIKKKKLEKKYAVELIDADRLMNKLRRLERLRQEILELNQSTISEIRSYQKPPEAVHQVMISVYLLLGYKEKELMDWRRIQGLIGRSGRESLKQQVKSLVISQIDHNVASYAQNSYLSKYDLISIREVSEGAATFFVWATSVIEEAGTLGKEREHRT